MELSKIESYNYKLYRSPLSKIIFSALQKLFFVFVFPKFDGKGFLKFKFNTKLSPKIFSHMKKKYKFNRNLLLNTSEINSLKWIENQKRDKNQTA